MQQRGADPQAGLPLSLYRAGWIVGLHYLLPGKVLNVNSSKSSTEEETADLLWLENLELNRYTGGKAMTETMWRCDQVRAGQLYNRMMFDTREEAEHFVRRMQQMEPDQMFSIEAIEAKQVWN